MALRIWTAVAVFLGSYLPLSVILAIQDLAVDRQYGIISSVYFKHPILSCLFLLLTCVGLAVTIIVLQYLRAQQSIRIDTIKHIPAEMISYVFPYIVSSMGVSYDDYAKLCGFIIFMGTIFLITYKLEKVFVNPLLAVFGWRLYEIRYSFSGDGHVYEGQALARGPEPVKTFARGVLVESLFIFREQARE